MAVEFLIFTLKGVTSVCWFSPQAQQSLCVAAGFVKAGWPVTSSQTLILLLSIYIKQTITLYLTKITEK